MGKKLLLVGFLALVSPGSLLQIWAAAVVALCLLALTVYAAPFRGQTENFLALASALALALTLFGALGFSLVARDPRNSLLTSSAMLALLVGAAIGVLLVAFAILAHSLASQKGAPVARHVDSS